MLWSPISIVFNVCALLNYWAGLYGEEEKAAIKAGAEQLARSTLEIAKGNQVARPNPDVLMITNG